MNYEPHDGAGAGECAYLGYCAARAKDRDNTYQRWWDELSEPERRWWTASAEASTQGEAGIKAIRVLAMIQNRCWKQHGHRYDADGVCLYCWFDQDQNAAPLLPPPLKGSK